MRRRFSLTTATLVGQVKRAEQERKRLQYLTLLKGEFAREIVRV